MSELVKYTLPDGRVHARVVSDRPPGDREDLDLDVVYARIRDALSRGLSDVQAALYAGCSDKTVWRYRQRRGIPASEPHRPRRTA